MTNNTKSRTLPLVEIDTDFDRFQFRIVEVDYGHVEELKGHYKRKAKIPPITVWQDPEDEVFYVLDGHHRFTALQQLQRKKVSVRVFQGSYEEARLMCLRENAKAQLPMSPEERQNAAWQLTQAVYEDGEWAYSKKRISETCGTSERTVATMRSTYKQLQEADAIIPEWSWRAALLSLKRLDAVDYTDEDRDAWVEAETGKLDEAIGKHLSLMLAKCPQAAFNVLATRLGDKYLSDFMDWTDHVPDDEDEDICPF